MAAAYREQRFGREVYLKDIASMKARYEQVRERGNVLHELRELMGDAPFWAGINRYTTAHFGTSVTTRDLHDAMEQVSGMDLDAFFDRWVYH
jgi:hypothetical protein